MKNRSSAASVEQIDLTKLSINIVSAYVSNNTVPAAELLTLLPAVHVAVACLNSVNSSAELELERPNADRIRRSIRQDALISFIDGKPYKMLKRHLSKHGMTIDQYRERYCLPRDYPSTAASYSEQCAALAKSLGLGRRHRQSTPKISLVLKTTAKALGGADHQKAAKASAGSARKP